MAPGPSRGKCTAYLRLGPGGMPLALRLTEVLGLTWAVGEILSLTGGALKDTREPVAIAPVCALGARLAFWVVFPLFVRAAEKPVWQDYRLDTMRLEEVKNDLQDLWILASVLVRRVPAFQDLDVASFGRRNTDNHLACDLVRRTIEGNSSDRIAASTLAGPLLKAIQEPRAADSHGGRVWQAVRVV